MRDLIFSDDTKHIYHRKCYQSLCHKGNLVRAQKKYEDDIASAAESKKRGRTSIEPSSSKTRKTFDQYLTGSLKETTRQKRTVKTTPVHYHVNDNTEIRNLKTFLSHVNTKAELTEYVR